MATTLASDADILREIEQFCSANRMGVTTFGRNALGDPNLVGNMRSGRSLTLKTAQRVRDYIVSHAHCTQAA